MTSEINYLAINENFPVAGQDNDTQVFRDNFDTIKNNFRLAKDEITDLQNTSARLDQDNDFNNKIITKAIFLNNKDKKWDAGFLTSDFTVDYEQGSYQLIRVGSTLINLNFLNFPTNNDSASPLGIGVGRVRLEIYGDATASRSARLFTSSGSVLKCNGFPNAKNGDGSQSVLLPPGSNDSPVLIEVWRHDEGRIFVLYIGQFI